MPFDYEKQPEWAGPLDERQAANGGPVLDVQALAQHSVRLPRLADTADGSLVPLSGPDPYRDPAREARERDEAARKAPDPGAALRDLIESSARRAGVAAYLARQTADNVLAAAAEPVVVPAAEPQAAAAPADGPEPAGTADQPVTGIRPRTTPKEAP